MTDRVFTKDLAFLNSLSAYNAEWYDAPQNILIPNWSGLTVLQQTTITTAMTANNYEFDHDQ